MKTEIEERIKQLKRIGHSYSAISKRLEISEDEIRRITGIKKVHPHHNFDGIGDNPEEIPLFIRENLAKQEYNNPLAVEKDRVKRNVCVICGKAKEEKWKLTNFCNLNCFTYGTQ